MPRIEMFRSYRTAPNLASNYHIRNDHDHSLLSFHSSIARAPQCLDPFLEPLDIMIIPGSKDLTRYGTLLSIFAGHNFSTIQMAVQHERLRDKFRSTRVIHANR